MIPVSAGDVHEYQVPVAPAGHTGPLPVFLIRTATLRQRAAWRRDLAATGARLVADGEMFDCLREAMRLAEPSNLDRLLESIDQAEAVAAGLVPQSPGLAEEIARYEVAALSYPPYAELQAARAYRVEMMALTGFKHFVIGWRDFDLPFRAKAGLVADDVIDRVPEIWLLHVGMAALGLMSPSPSQRGNSESPRQSPSAPVTSTAGSAPRMADDSGSVTTSTS